MVNNPFLISGTIYDRSGTAIGSGYTVVLENATTHETLSVSTDSNGAYQIEGGNLTSGITANDIIFLSCVYKADQYGEIMAKVSAANITTGLWTTGNIYCRNAVKVVYSTGSSYGLVHVSCTGYTATAYTIWILDRTNATGIDYRVKHVIAVPANSSAEAFVSPAPLLCDGGYRIIQCATAPTVHPNSLTAGVANVIGDTATEKVKVTISGR